ncbi:MAG TPA: PQQ-binding-like beta-propeller repeat protein [Rhodanobacteraceae bacterium]
MRIQRAIGTGVALACAAASSAAWANEWPVYQGDPEHTGYVNEPLQPFNAHPTPLWTASVQAVAVSGLAVSDGVVVTVPSTYFANETPLVAVSAVDGTPLWSVDFGSVFSLNQPAIDGGNVYAQVSNNYQATFISAYALDGTFQWRAPFDSQWEHYLGPIAVNGTLYFDGGEYGGMYAFNEADGSESFYTNLPQYDSWSPTWADGNLIVYTNELDVISASTGQIVQTITDPDYDWRGYSPDESPIVIGNRAYATNYGRLIAFDLDQGTIAWVRNVNATGQVSTDGINLFVVAGGALTMRDPANGDAIWSWIPSASGSVTTRIVVTKSHAIVGDDTNTYLVNLQTHQTDSTLATSGLIAYAENTIFIADSSGTLSAYRFVDPIFASGFDP